jgi:hypothetical protein
MTLDAFLQQYLGQKCDFDGVNGGQCIDLARMYCKDVLNTTLCPPLGVNGKAADIWTTYNQAAFVRVANSPTGVPQKGDIVIWNTNMGAGYGHVSVFLEGTATSFTSFDQNFPTLSVCTKTAHTYTNVVGWLHPIAATSSDPKYTEDQMTAVRLERDKNWTLYKDAQSQITDLKAQLKGSQDDLRGFLEYLGNKFAVIADANAIKGAVERILGVEEQLRLAQRALDDEKAKHAADITTLQDQIAKLKQEVEQQQKENKTILDRLNTLETRSQAQQQQVQQLSWLDHVLQSLKGLIERKK